MTYTLAFDAESDGNLARMLKPERDRMAIDPLFKAAQVLDETWHIASRANSEGQAWLIYANECTEPWEDSSEPLDPERFLNRLRVDIWDDDAVLTKYGREALEAVKVLRSYEIT